MRTGLIIFIRNPVLGQVKTRLAKTIGAEKALHIYNLLLAHTHDITKELSCDKFVYYSEHIDETDIWENELFHKKLQSDGGLGEKMQHAFKELFAEGYDRLVIIGSDCFKLMAENIVTAIMSLENNQAVIGPSADGGYYLLGMSALLPFVFENKQWSSSTVLEQTINDFQQHEISFRILPVLADIDEEKDLPLFFNLQPT